MGTLKSLALCILMLSVIHNSPNLEQGPDSDKKLEDILNTKLQNLKFDFFNRIYTITTEFDPFNKSKSFVLQLDSEPYTLPFNDYELVQIISMCQRKNISTQGGRSFYIYAKMVQFGETYAIIRFSLTQELNIKLQYWPFTEISMIYQHLISRIKRSDPDSHSDFMAVLTFLIREARIDTSLLPLLTSVVMMISCCPNQTFVRKILSSFPKSEWNRIADIMLKVVQNERKKISEPDSLEAINETEKVLNYMLSYKAS